MLYASMYVFFVVWFIAFLCEYDEAKGFLIAIWEALGITICLLIIGLMLGLLGHWGVQWLF